MILAIESSGKTASVAVLNEEVVVCESAQSTGFFHSQTLMVLVQNMLTVAGIELEQLSLVAVSCGPGSFTGLRIGVSAARGLAAGLGINCAGVSTLRGLAANLHGLPVFACALIDARNDFFYCGLFNMELNQQIGSDEVVSFEALKLKLQALKTGGKPIFLVGDGAKQCYLRLKEQESGLNLRLACEQLRSARAVGVAVCARSDLQNSCLNVNFELNYLRQSQAQRLLIEKQQKGRLL